MPPNERQPGQAQEDRVRSHLVAEGYEQPYGTTDDEIRRNLVIEGRCADFVGYHRQLNMWLIAESKGSDMRGAEEQLTNTAKGLLAREPGASGRIEYHVYTDRKNYNDLTHSRNGLGGYRQIGGFLGYRDDDENFVFSHIEGTRMQVLMEAG
ncbi:MAG TPA: hypothetical protein VJ183_07555 [Chloroflexia bacterium]|nr:hypothetical protein [Chloroflexia bacterium]